MQANGLTATAKLYDDNGNVEEEIPVDYNGYLEASKIEEPDPAAYGVWIPGIPGLVEKGLQAVHCAQWLQQLILNGVIAGVGAVLGWLPIPLMNANLDVLFRTCIPVEMQGRVYAARDSLQFFTIPLGYLLGGALVDTVFEPFMAVQTPESLFCCLFGTGKGSGAAFLFLVLGFLGVAVCLCFRRSKLIRGLEANDKD